MKISLDWITDYVTLPDGLLPRQIAYDLTMATVEVESVHEIAADVEAGGPPDVIFEIDNKSMTNRPDLWGHYGIARELAAIYGVTLKPLPDREPALPPATLLGTIDESGCHRFTATTISGIGPTPTPSWMRRRLVNVGQRSRGLLADLTNYVMLATGQPCHAFDADRLDLPLSVRRARPGERFQALDGTACTLGASDLVVADRAKAVGLAGVIGAAETAISDGTRNVLLEIASFDALSIRRTSAAVGLRTEASTRFEKSLSTHRIDDTRRLFFDLLHAVAPGARVTGFEDRRLADTPTATIHTDADFLRRRIGKALSVADVREPLERLGFGVEADGERLTVTVPEWRNTGDISGPHDLIEEIARLHGYEQFAFQAPLVRLDSTARNFPRDKERRVKEYLAFVCGLQEVITYPWVEDRFVEGAGITPGTGALRLATPPAPNQTTLRTSLVPGLLQSIEVNAPWKAEFKIFEAGRVFPSDRFTGDDQQGERLPAESTRLAAAFIGPDAEAAFREAKGVIETMGRRAHVLPVVSQPGEAPSWADPGAYATLVTRGLTAGHLALLNRRGRDAAGLKHGHAVIFELDLGTLESLPSRTNRYERLPELPPFDVDVSLVYPDAVSWAEIAAASRGVDPLIAAITFIDQYHGTGVPAAHRSITLRAHLQPAAQTLTSEEAAAVADRIREMARARLGAIDRG